MLMCQYLIAEIDDTFSSSLRNLRLVLIDLLLPEMTQNILG